MPNAIQSSRVGVGGAETCSEAIRECGKLGDECVSFKLICGEAWLNKIGEVSTLWPTPVLNTLKVRERLKELMAPLIPRTIAELTRKPRVD